MGSVSFRKRLTGQNGTDPRRPLLGHQVLLLTPVRGADAGAEGSQTSLQNCRAAVPGALSRSVESWLDGRNRGGIPRSEQGSRGHNAVRLGSPTDASVIAEPALVPPAYAPPLLLGHERRRKAPQKALPRWADTARKKSDLLRFSDSSRSFIPASWLKTRPVWTDQYVGRRV